MICDSLNLLFFTSVSLGDGLSLKPGDQEGDRSAPFYSPIGWPSIDPELMIRVLLVGYCLGIARSGACARRSTST
jgi:hypothetical protein